MRIGRRRVHELCMLLVYRYLYFREIVESDFLKVSDFEKGIL